LTGISNPVIFEAHRE